MTEFETPMETKRRRGGVEAAQKEVREFSEYYLLPTGRRCFLLI